MCLPPWGRVLCGLAVLLLFTGCGDGRPKPVKVEGVVTLDGKPVGSGVEISFIPEGGEGRGANGTTGAEGEFRLSTYSTGDGAVPGTYKVMVRYAVASAGQSDLAEVYKSDPASAYKKRSDMEAKAKAGKNLAPTAPKRVVIPANYGDAKTPLKQVIPPSELPLKLELRSSGS